MKGSRSTVCAVIPARDEEGSILAAIRNAREAGADVVHVIANGCTDRTARLAAETWPPVSVHVFDAPLGVDVPRGIGAALCLAGGGAVAALFIDGDMAAPLGRPLRGLVEAVVGGMLEISLSDCAGPADPAGAAGLRGMFGEVIRARLDLNRRLGLDGSLGAATPSHGPFACSLSFLSAAGPEAFSVPPLLLSVASRNGLRAGVGMRVRHEALGSPYRGPLHARLVADTLIGDCAEAIAFHEGKPRTRAYGGRLYEGLNPERRFDILRSAVANILAS